MQRYDIAIIGTGPAGLEAAITAKVRNKKILLLGNSNLSSKVKNAHTINNYLGLPAVSGSDMVGKFNEHIENMGIEITNDKVSIVYSMGDYFAIQGRSEMYEATAVILASGMSVNKPIDGEIDNLGRGVSYCATCDAALYRGKTTIVIGFTKEEEREVEFLSEFADKIYYLPMYEEEVSITSNDKIEIQKGKKPLSIKKNEDNMTLILENGNLEAYGIFILRENVIADRIIPGLELSENSVIVDRSMKTNLDGVFACGDITGPPYQYIKAAGEGNVAALSAVMYVDGLKKYSANYIKI